MATLRAYPGARVEVLGWDEAFVGLDTDDVEATDRDVQAKVLAATGLHCSIGVGDTLVRARNDTDFGKPRGVFRLTRESWLPHMGHRPTTELWGVGPRIGQRPAALGVEIVEQIARTPDDVLAAELGPTIGPHIGRLGRGVRPTVDDTPWPARPVGGVGARSDDRRSKRSCP